MTSTQNRAGATASLLLAFLLAACGAGSDGTNGTNGVDGKSALVHTQSLPAGSSNCASGGTLIESGIDANGNGSLDASEVTASQSVCNGSTGASGSSSLVSVSAVPTGDPTCASGGQLISVGTDSDGNGVLANSEITSSRYVCNGAAGKNGTQSLIAMLSEPAGANCASGGTRITSGLDANGNGVLDASEVTNTAYVCQGATGAVGPAGAAGPAGASALIASLSLSAGDATCANGGTEILMGANNDGSGSLIKNSAPNSSNVTQVSYVCNGATVSANGVGALVKSVTLAAGDANCAYGGTKIITGLDNDGTGTLINGSTLNATNLANATYICNGSPAGLVWSNVTTAAQTMAANSGYIADNASTRVALTLPASSTLSIGDIVRVKGKGAAGWSIAQNASQSISLTGLTTYSSLLGSTGANRQYLSTNFDGASSAISASGQYVLVSSNSSGSAQGVYLSSDGGNQWAKVSSGSGTNLPAGGYVAVAMSATGDRMFATNQTSHALYISTDGGSTWGIAGNWASMGVTHSSNSIAMSASGLMVLVSVPTDGSFISYDGGVTWAAIPALSVPHDTSNRQGLAAMSADGRTMYLAYVGQNIYMSTDFGATWSPSGSVTDDWTGLATSADGQVVVAQNRLSGASGGLYVSTNTGVSFTRKLNGPSSGNWMSVAVSADGDFMLANTFQNGIFSSYDGGNTWQQVNATNRWWTPMAMTPDGAKAVMAVTSSTAGGIVVSAPVLNHAATTTVGATGGLQGGPADVLELQYLGSGLFGVLSATNAGDITSN